MLINHCEGSSLFESANMNLMAAIMFALLVARVTSGSSVTAPACVISGSNVVIGFGNDNAKVGDWIGLIPEHAVSSHALPDPHDDNWIWTCGSQDCKASPNHGSTTISTPNLTGASKWVAVLARDIGESNRRELLATSSPFYVSSSCPDLVCSTWLMMLLSTRAMNHDLGYLLSNLADIS